MASASFQLVHSRIFLTPASNSSIEGNEKGTALLSAISHTAVQSKGSIVLEVTALLSAISPATLRRYD